MFTYKTLSKEKGVATIELINNTEEMYVPAQQQRTRITATSLFKR